MTISRIETLGFLVLIQILLFGCRTSKVDSVSIVFRPEKNSFSTGEQIEIYALLSDEIVKSLDLSYTELSWSVFRSGNRVAIGMISFSEKDILIGDQKEWKLPLFEQYGAFSFDISGDYVFRLNVSVSGREFHGKCVVRIKGEPIPVRHVISLD